MPKIHGGKFFFITKNFELDPCFRRAHLVKHPNVHLFVAIVYNNLILRSFHFHPGRPK